MQSPFFRVISWLEKTEKIERETGFFPGEHQSWSSNVKANFCISEELSLARKGFRQGIMITMKMVTIVMIILLPLLLVKKRKVSLPLTSRLFPLPLIFYIKIYRPTPWHATVVPSGVSRGGQRGGGGPRPGWHLKHGHYNRLEGSQKRKRWQEERRGKEKRTCGPWGLYAPPPRPSRVISTRNGVLKSWQKRKAWSLCFLAYNVFVSVFGDSAPQSCRWDAVPN